MRRNPQKNPQRRTEANTLKTAELVEAYRGKVDLLATWEQQPEDVRIRNHEYILTLRAKERMKRNLIAHRSYEVEL